MKFFLIIFLYLTVNISSSIADINSELFWIRQNSPSSKNLRDCFFINASTGWASGDSGIILKTSNSGINWSTQSSGTKKDIQAIFFINNNLGWALAWNIDSDSITYPGTLFMKTTNSGSNWSISQFPDTNYFYGSIFFVDSLKGYIGGIPNFIRYTTNGGQTWINAVSDSSTFYGYPVTDIEFMNSQTGYACGGLRDLAGLVWKTINGGISWSPRILGPDTIGDFFIKSPDTIFAGSGDFKFGVNYFTSGNAGDSWINYSLPYFGIITSVDFRTPREGWMTIGYQQKMFLSNDYGNNWKIMDPPENSQLFDIFFADSLNGWSVGEAGAIFKYNNLVSSRIEKSDGFGSFELYQNFPNPFNPETTIRYRISENSNVLIKIFDALGNEIQTLINKKQSAGNHSVNFSSGSLPSGIYFYVMHAGKNSFAKKMLIIK